jgi:hypothetical protein
VTGRAGQILILGVAVAAVGCGRGAVGASDGGTGGGGTTAAGGAGAGLGAGGLCGTLTSYTPTTTTPLSFATDVYPLLLDVGSVPPTTPGCAAASICHGSSPIFLDPGGKKKLSFTDPPSTVLAALLASAVNAPTMKLVVPGNVERSFFAYKISGADGLACADAACVSGASVGTSRPCGDPMPTATVGVLTGVQRTAILDWIALGADP